MADTCSGPVHKSPQDGGPCPCGRVTEVLPVQAHDGVTVRTTTYEVTAYPFEDINRGLFTVKVEYRGDGLWAVLWRSFCLHRQTGSWDMEFIPSERRADWLAEHRWPLDEALAKARELAPTLTVNGWTVSGAGGRARTFPGEGGRG